MEETKLPIGTRIKFVRSLYGAANDESPACVYAEKGDGGIVTGHGCWEGHWVKWDNWEHPFGAKLGQDFIKCDGKIMDRVEGYYWCKLGGKWVIFIWCDGWYDGAENSYKEIDFEEIDERRITRE